MRTFLYHHSAPGGKIFTDEAEYEKALNDGWVEAPWLVGKQSSVEPPKERVSLNISFSPKDETTELSEPIVSGNEKPRTTESAQELLGVKRRGNPNWIKKG